MLSQSRQSIVDRSPAHGRIAAALLLLLGARALAQAEKGRFLGPASCSAQSCHGSTLPRTTTPVLQNEYYTWSGAGARKDKHSRAYAVLLEPTAQRIGALMHLARKPQEDMRCLACHDLAVPPEKVGREFAAGDGVSCESCHGPSSQWLGPHTEKGCTITRHADNLKLGMFETRDLAQCAQVCMGCHVGDPQLGATAASGAPRFVDHELIAAGHPDLTFELATFLYNMPPHWSSRAPRWGQVLDRPADRFQEARIWAVGQAVALVAQLERIADRAGDKLWPEYAELSCGACHHPLTTAYYASVPTDSWRQQAGYAGRRPGNMPMDTSRFAAYRQLLSVIAPAEGQALASRMAHLAELVSSVNPPRQATQDAARKAIESARELIDKVQSAPYDESTIQKVVRAIAGSGESIAAGGQRCAQQAAWALDLLIGMAFDKDRAKEPKRIVDEMFRQVDTLSDYSAPRFAELMKELAGTLR